MPSFEFTSPEGKKYTVDGPAGATKEQAFQILQGQLATAASDQPDPQMAGVPGYDAQGRKQGPAAAPADPSLVDKLLGVGETGLTLATGLTTGMAGMVGGGIAGAVGNLTGGRYGMRDGVEAGMQQGAESLTYTPRTATGQEYAGAVGEALASALPVMPMTAEMNAMGRGVSTAARGARDLARPAAGAATRYAEQTNAAQNAADAAARAAPKQPMSDLVRAPKPAMPGVGAAKTDQAAIRADRFERLGYKPTLGQLTRDKQQIKFERETAKLEEGKALDDHFAEQNAHTQRKFEDFADDTGAQVSDLRDVGNSVLDAVEAKAAAKKAKARATYEEADAAGEMAAPVDVSNVLTFVKANKGKDKVAPIISMIESELGQNAKEVGGNLDNLTLTPTPKRLTMSLRASEDLRQAINETMEPGTPNSVWGKKAIRLIDQATEDKGGPLYRQARREYENYMKEFGDRDVIAKLLRMKPGTKDRAVALEDVFKHTILNPRGKDDISHVFRVLEAHPADMDPAIVAAGRQAAADLRGALVNHIRDKMFSNGGANTLGDVVGSQKKIRVAIDDLDARGKLKAVFGNEGARHLRDLRDAAVDLYTAPDGAVNHSNNVGPIVEALRGAERYAKVIPGANYVVKNAADAVRSRVIAKKIEKALNPERPGKQPIPTSPQKRPRGATVH